ncbi:hypothetical protein AWZ03_000496 [Drosophila navojoa]|uniref:Uncharacterized protein n=1 Tax=Drosophila navojoa TaxID=7232 RepID=A0A484BW72_DRONA|nr:hypothetical protein AWZ03_000496 [Drosophila navojoa]
MPRFCGARLELKMQNCASRDVFEVQPVLVKKQPKFPTRERHMAIRRKKSVGLTLNVTPSGGTDDKQFNER